MRTIGYIDGLESVDPDTGTRSVQELTGGLFFRFSDAANPDAVVVGKLAVRTGGMVVFETSPGAGATMATMGAMGTTEEGTTPLTPAAEHEISLASERPAPRLRPASDTAKRSRPESTAESAADSTPTEPVAAS